MRVRTTRSRTSILQIVDTTQIHDNQGIRTATRTAIDIRNVDNIRVTATIVSMGRIETRSALSVDVRTVGQPSIHKRNETRPKTDIGRNSISDLTVDTTICDDMEEKRTRTLCQTMMT